MVLNIVFDDMADVWCIKITTFGVFIYIYIYVYICGVYKNDLLCAMQSQVCVVQTCVTMEDSAIYRI